MKLHFFQTQAAIPAILVGILCSPTCVFAETHEVSWTGFYAGLVGGHTWGSSSMELSPDGFWLTRTDLPTAIPDLKAGGSQTYNSNGFMGGLEAGYNYQIDRFVIGLEGDFSYQDLSQSRSSGPKPFLAELNSGDTITFDGGYKSEWISTVRTRFGYSIGNFLGFLTGGLAIADYNFNSGYTITEFGNIYSAKASSSQTLVGWTVGAGTEYAIGDKWSVKAEYLYANFSNPDNANSLLEGAGVGGLGYTAGHAVSDVYQHIARVGVNYRF